MNIATADGGKYGELLSSRQGRNDLKSQIGAEMLPPGLTVEAQEVGGDELGWIGLVQ
jgi:hypothetical protein